MRLFFVSYIKKVLWQVFSYEESFYLLIGLCIYCFKDAIYTPGLHSVPCLKNYKRNLIKRFKLSLVFLYIIGGVLLLHIGLFFPRVIFALFHLQMVSHRLEFAQTKLWIKKIVWDIDIFPVLNSTADNEGKGAKINGANIFMYTVFKCWKCWLIELLKSCFPCFSKNKSCLSCK